MSGLLCSASTPAATNLHEYNVAGLLPCCIQVDDVLMLQPNVQADLGCRTVHKLNVVIMTIASKRAACQPHAGVQ